MGLDVEPLEGDVCLDCGQQLYLVKETNQSYCFHCNKYE